MTRGPINGSSQGQNIELCRVFSFSTELLDQMVVDVNEALTKLFTKAGSYQGDGINHVGQKFTGLLILKPGKKRDGKPMKSLARVVVLKVTKVLSSMG